MTVGHGHLIRHDRDYVLEDGTLRKGSDLSVGDKLDEEHLLELFLEGVREARDAAVSQAEEMGVDNPELVKALVSVNYQLGTDWTRKFYNSWPALVKGDYAGAAEGFKKSLWAKQTPTRVKDFVSTIESLA